MNGRVDRERRREEAEVRNAKWAVLTPEQQIAKLDVVFGAGKGAVKQRAKILKRK
jgi:Spy/CpxP family protein refolding chaperone